MSAQKTLVTADELLCISAEGKRCELIRGEVIDVAPTGGLHGRVANRIAYLLTAYVEPRGLGTIFAAETGFLLQRNPDTVRAPDAAFVAKQRLPSESVAEGYVDGPPDLAVEVISPGDSASQVQAKTRAWLHAGTRLVWVVYPESKTVMVYRSRRDVTELSGGDILDGQPVFPDFSAPVDEVFR